MLIRNIILGIFILIIIAETNYLNNKNVFFEKLNFLSICLASIALFLTIKSLPTKWNNKLSRIALKSVKALLASVLLFLMLIEATTMDFSGKLFDVEFFYHFELAAFLLGVKEYALEFTAFIIFLIVLCWSIIKEHPRDTLKKQWITWLIALAILAVYFNLTVVGRFIKGYQKYYTSLNLPVVIAEDVRKLSHLGISASTLKKSHINATAGNNKNVITIYLESFSDHFTNDQYHKGLTPRLDQLAKDNSALTSYYSNAGFTVDGLISSNCGLVPNMAQGNNSMTGSKKMYTQLPCMTDVLKRAGYYQEFIGGASKSFAGKGDFLIDHGFNRVWGWEDFEQMPKFKDDYEKSWWGLHDEDLFAFAIERIKKADNNDSPYHMDILTLSTHLKGFPSPSCQKFAPDSDKFLDAIFCSDYLVGQFIDELKKENLLENTIVVITADHQVFNTELTQKLFSKDIKKPKIFGVIIDGSHENIDTPMALYDLGPTILDLLNIKHDIEFILGKSVLEASKDRLLFRRDQYRTNDQWIKPQFTCQDIDVKQVELPFDQCEYAHVMNSMYGFASSFSADRGIKINNTSELEISFDTEKKIITDITLNKTSIISEFRRDGFVLNPVYLGRDGLFTIFFDAEKHHMHNLFNFTLTEYSQIILGRLIRSNHNQSMIIFSNARDNNAPLINSLGQKLQLECFHDSICIKNDDQALEIKLSDDAQHLKIRMVN